MKPRDLADLTILGSIWGASFLFMRIAAPEFGPFLMVAMRVLSAGLFLTPILLHRGTFTELSSRKSELVILGIFNQAIPFTLFAYVALHMEAGITAILNATVPLWGAMIGAIWFQTKLRAMTIGGMLLGFSGVVMLVVQRSGLSSNDSAGLALAACLLATLCYGFGANYARRHFVGVDPIATTAGCQLIASLVVCPVALAYLPEQMPSLLACLSVTCLGVLCTAIAYLLFYRLIRNAGPTNTMSVTYLVPIFGVLWSALFLQERVTVPMLTAGAVILVGVAITAGLFTKS